MSHLLYVSDVLENLLEGAETRNILRRQCMEVLQDLPESTAASLRPPLEYVAGKCMGYPAVWLVRTALGLQAQQTAQLVREHPAAIYVSLSTSIADDFLDGERNVGGPHMMLLYLFVFAALGHPHWFCGPERLQWVERVYPLIGMFAAQRSSPGDSVKPTRRIGAFFEVVTYSLTSRLKQPQRESLLVLAGKFGEWCCELDDMLDVESDIEKGDHGSFPISWLAQHSDDCRLAIARRDPEGCSRWITSDAFRLATRSRVRQQLEALVLEARTVGFSELARALEAALHRLDSALQLIAARVAAQAKTTLHSETTASAKIATTTKATPVAVVEAG